MIYARIGSAVEQTVNGQVCGIRYNVDILEAFKFELGAPKSSELVFGRSPGLELGQEYILFIQNADELEPIFDLFSGGFQTAMQEQVGRAITQQKRLDFLKCNGLVPGPEYDAYMAWEVLDADRILIDGLLPRPWPSSIYEFVGSSTGLHYISRNDLFDYLRHIQTNGQQDDK